MFKRTLLPFTIIFAGLVFFTSTAVSSDKSSNKVITADELQKKNSSFTYYIKMVSEWFYVPRLFAGFF